MNMSDLNNRKSLNVIVVGGLNSTLGKILKADLSDSKIVVKEVENLNELSTSNDVSIISGEFINESEFRPILKNYMYRGTMVDRHKGVISIPPVYYEAQSIRWEKLYVIFKNIRYNRPAKRRTCNGYNGQRIMNKLRKNNKLKYTCILKKSRYN